MIKNISSNEKLIGQFIRYVFVGAAAFFVDAGTLWLVSFFTHYLIAAACGFITGLVANYFLSKLFVFKEKTAHPMAEFIAYAAIGVVGLGITELLMYIFTDVMGIYYLISKVITAAVVLIWNFAARKLLLYRGNKK